MNSFIAKRPVWLLVAAVALALAALPIALIHTYDRLDRSHANPRHFSSRDALAQLPITWAT